MAPPPAEVCPVCHRTKAADDAFCVECYTALGGGSPFLSSGQIDAATVAARRAWDFSRAELDVAPRSGGGDPGPSRWKPRKRR